MKRRILFAGLLLALALVNAFGTSRPAFADALWPQYMGGLSTQHSIIIDSYPEADNNAFVLTNYAHVCGLCSASFSVLVNGSVVSTVGACDDGCGTRVEFSGSRGSVVSVGIVYDTDSGDINYFWSLEGQNASHIPERTGHWADHLNGFESMKVPALFTAVKQFFASPVMSNGLAIIFGLVVSLILIQWVLRIFGVITKTEGGNARMAGGTDRPPSYDNVPATPVRRGSSRNQDTSKSDGFK